MGQKLTSVLFGILGFILLSMFCLLLGKCVYKEYTKPDASQYVNDVRDTIVTHCACIDYVETEFHNANEMIQTQIEMCEESEYNEQFCSMPASVVKNVTDMLLTKKTVCSIRDVVEEYNRNKAIYDKMAPNAIQKEDPPVATSEESIIRELQSDSSTTKQ